MQVIFEDEVEGNHSREIDTVGSVIYTGRIGRCMERKHHGRVRVRGGRV